MSEMFYVIGFILFKLILLPIFICFIFLKYFTRMLSDLLIDCGEYLKISLQDCYDYLTKKEINKK